MADFTLALGATPTIAVTCETSTGVVKDLTGASATLIVRDPALTSATINATATIDTDPTTGKVSYTFGAADFTNPGFYLAQVKITYADSTVETFPDSDDAQAYLTIQVNPSLTGTVTPSGFGTSVQTLIEQTLGYLRGRQRPIRNRLNGAIEAADTTLVLDFDPKLLSDNSRICVGLEVMHVWAVAGNTVTVERGVDGSKPLAHPDKAIVHIDPEYTSWQIFDAFNTELRALSSAGIYQVKSVDLTISETVAGYDLAADVLRVLDVRWQDPCDDTRWSEVQGWSLTRDMSADVFSSGVGLIIPPRRWRPLHDANLWSWLPSGRGPVKARVRYAAELDTLTTGYDDVADTGVPATAVDILPMGAALIVGRGRATQQVAMGAQPDPRDAARVRVADVLNAWSALRVDHDKRVADEAARLSRQWVYRQPTRTIANM